SLAGVGQKTANVVYSVAFGGDAIAVDTHVFRVSKRIGFSSGKTPLQVEEDLKKYLPKSRWAKSHHLLIFLGRRICYSRKPNCSACPLADKCKKTDVCR
ncbi:MAG: endonuclease III, partial [Clostridia bacterium]|nr:endonuclease III [Clostridia bacterium]